MKNYQLTKLIVLAALLPGLAGCGGGGTAPAPDTTLGTTATGPAGNGSARPDAATPEIDSMQPFAAVPDPTMDLDTALAEIDALATPADVDAAVFAQLKAELARLLGEAGGMPLRSSSGQEVYHYVPDRFNLRVSEQNTRLKWLYMFEGDYDQNGTVNAADIVPLAKYFGKVADDTTGERYFPVGSLQSVVDQNYDGAINITDLVAIGRNYGNQVTGYDLYAGEDRTMFPLLDSHNRPYANPAAQPRSSVSLDGLQPGPGGQLFAELTVPGETRSYYWLAQNSLLKPDSYSFIARPGELLGAVEQGLQPFRETATQLRYNTVDNSVSWLDIFPGDGDGNTSVNVADITPMGTNFGSSVGPQDEENPAYRIDYNGDGVVDLRDLAVLISRLGGRIEGYRLYHAGSAVELPDGYWGTESGSPVLEVEYSVNFFSSLRISTQLDFTPASGSWLYLRPYYGEQLGPVCEFVQVP